MLSPTPCLLSINNYFYPRGGAEVLFLEQNRMFEDIGWQVVPFAMRHSRNLPTRKQARSRVARDLFAAGPAQAS